MGGEDTYHPFNDHQDNDSVVSESPTSSRSCSPVILIHKSVRIHSYSTTFIRSYIIIIIRVAVYPLETNYKVMWYITDDHTALLALPPIPFAVYIQS